MRQIKFRGVAATNGREVFGSGAYVQPGFECVVSNMIYIHCVDGSVKQLVGVDKNGREVYEGDKIVLDGVIATADMSLIHDLANATLEEES